jgi:hypothetical protein
MSVPATNFDIGGGVSRRSTRALGVDGIRDQADFAKLDLFNFHKERRLVGIMQREPFSVAGNAPALHLTAVG